MQKGASLFTLRKLLRVHKIKVKKYLLALIHNTTKVSENALSWKI